MEEGSLVGFLIIQIIYLQDIPIDGLVKSIHREGTVSLDFVGAEIGGIEELIHGLNARFNFQNFSQNHGFLSFNVFFFSKQSFLFLGIFDGIKNESTDE